MKKVPLTKISLLVQIVSTSPTKIGLDRNVYNPGLFRRIYMESLELNNAYYIHLDEIPEFLLFPKCDLFTYLSERINFIFHV